MFGFSIHAIRAAAAAAICALGMLHAAAAQATMVGGTITVRIDDEYYALYTQTHGGTFSPYGNATVDPNNPQIYYMPITTDTYLNPFWNIFAFNAEGSGITFTTAGGVTGSLVNWGLLDPAFPGFIFPFTADPLDNSSYFSVLQSQLFVDLSRDIPGIIGPGYYDSTVVPVTFQENALDAWLASGFPLLDYTLINPHVLMFFAAEQDWNYFEISVTPPAAAAAVPEPSALALFGAGLLAVHLRRRRSSERKG